jgi:hypothetical protein
MSKDAYYFSHDSNARNDLKIVKLRQYLGLEGYGLYWCVIEMLRESNKYELPINDIPPICFELRIDEKKFEKLFDCELLFKGAKMFYSKSLKNRMLRLDKIKQKRKIAGAKGGKSKAIAKQELSISEASKVNKSIVNNNILNKRKAFIENVIVEADLLNYDKTIWEPFCQYWTDIDYESKLMQFQVKENFAIPTRLKGWKKLSESGNNLNYETSISTFKRRH